MDNTPDSELEHKDLQTTATKKFHETNTKLKSLSENLGLEEIHAFRVEIKKLKAFLRLFRNSANHPAKLKFPKNLNKIYKSLGSLRELQLQQEKLEKAIDNQNNLLPDTLSKLGNEIDTFKSKTIQLFKYKKYRKKEEAKILKFIPENLTGNTIESYFIKKMRELQKILSMKRVSIKTLHRMRKILKDLQYNRSYRINIPAPEVEQALIPDDDIHHAATLIGNYHDLYTAIVLMEEELNTYPINENEKAILLKVRLLWKKEKEIQRKEIEGEMEKLRVFTGDFR
jgi:CHAD domain-containing protein